MKWWNNRHASSNSLSQQQLDEHIDRFWSLEDDAAREALLCDLRKLAPEVAATLEHEHELDLLELDRSYWEAYPERSMQRYGDYFLNRKLAEGGTASVFEATCADTGANYALKVPTRESSIPGDPLKRLQREYKVMGDCNCDHIPKVYRVSLDAESPCLAMQLIVGRNEQPIRLAEAMASPVVHHAQRVRWIKDILTAVEKVHAIGYVHRDIKPENILLDHDNHVYLVDFGLAILDLQSEPRLTKAMTPLGTDHYMAPEVRRGFRPTIAADIYSMGVLIFDVISGKSRRHPNELLQDFDDSHAAFDELIEIACDENPDRRFHSIEELRDAFNDALVDQRSSKAIKKAERSWKWAYAMLAFSGFLGLAFIVLWVTALELYRQDSIDTLNSLDNQLIQMQQGFATELGKNEAIIDQLQAVEHSQKEARASGEEIMEGLNGGRAIHDKILEDLPEPPKDNE